MIDQRHSKRALFQGFRFSLTVLLALNLSACLIVPFPTTVEPLPFPDEKVAQIAPGVTSRQQVIDLLGKPDIEGPGPSLALYGDDRRIAGVFVVVPEALGAVPIKTGHLLVLNYDENALVREAELFRKGLFRNNSEVCTISGICIKPRIDSTGAKFRILDAEFYDTPENDAGAKLLSVPPDLCVVYVFLDTNFWAGNKVLVHSVGHPSSKRHLDKTGYLLWLRSPGFQHIVASDEMHSGKPVPPGKEAESKFEFDCRAAQSHFIRATLRWNWGEGKHHLELSLDDPAEGAKALRKRRLVVVKQ